MVELGMEGGNPFSSSSNAFVNLNLSSGRISYACSKWQPEVVISSTK